MKPDLDHLLAHLAITEPCCREAIDDVQAELQSHREREASGGWVACSERMPERLVEVLFYEDGATYWDGEGARWWADGSEEPVPFPCQEVTHWMPLLAPPEGSAATEGE